MPPEGTAVVGVKERVMGTDDLPTIRSEDAMVKDTDDTPVKMLPDETALADGHKRYRRLTPTEPAVSGPIVKPAMVTVTTADAAMAAPEVVITTAVLEVAPHVAVKPATLLAPKPTVGTTEDAKKFVGYERVKVLPDATRPVGENTSVTATDSLPAILPEAAIPNVDTGILKQYP